MYFKKSLIAAIVTAAAGNVPCRSRAHRRECPDRTSQCRQHQQRIDQSVPAGKRVEAGTRGGRQHPGCAVHGRREYLPGRPFNWDMIDFGGTGSEYIPTRSAPAAGDRYNRNSGDAALLLVGNNSGSFIQPGCGDPQTTTLAG